MVNATEDERLPRPAIETLYAAARDPKEIVWLPGIHVQRNRPEVVRGLVTTVLTMMERDEAAGGRVAAAQPPRGAGAPERQPGTLGAVASSERR